MTVMERPSSCPRCGSLLVNRTCPACDREVAFRFVHREIVALVVLGVVTVLGFVLTRAAAERNRALRLRDAAVWYGAGEDHLVAGRTDLAIRALRRATAINRDDRPYRIALAGALAEDRQDAVAMQVLMGIRESTPEDPDVNVQLARLEARNNDVMGALRHYENAVYGRWSADDGDARRALRIELIRFLLHHHQRGRALSELLVLSDNLPDDVRSQAEAGQLFLDAREPRRALERYQRSLRLDPKSQAALVGASEAAFDAGDYRLAQRYVRLVTSTSDQVSEIRMITDLVLARDPLQPGLSFGERRALTQLDFDQATAVLNECINAQQKTNQANNLDLQFLRDEAVALEPALSSSGLRRSPDAIATVVNLIYRIEQQIGKTCGPGSAFDRALLLIGQRHEADQP